MNHAASPIRVLLAEDDRDHRHLLRAVLQQASPRAEVHAVGSAPELADAVARRRFDCIVLDYNLGSVRADEVIRDQGAEFRGTPVVVISSSEGQRIVIASLRSGVADFVPKFDALTGDTLWRRVESAVATARRARSDRRVTERRERRLLKIAETDTLTGLSNRRHLDRLLADGRFRVDRRANTACVMIDIDHFKSINDRHGHAFGDAVLRAVAGAVRTIAGPGAAAVRWGGEEFLVVRHEDSATDAWLWAEAVRRRVEALEVRDGGEGVRPTASIGLAFGPTRELSAESINRADHAMYLAKDRGRNAVATWDMVVVEGLAENLSLRPGSLRRRRDDLIDQLAASLGPAQRSHLTEHCERVSDAAVRLASALGLPADESERIGLAGLLHDIGKVVIPEELLSKPSGLTADEHAIMERHAEEGAQITSRLGADAATEEAVRGHHTRFDSPGSPPCLAARVVGVADALVAMTTDRPYRSARTPAQALEELRRNRGLQFDPDTVAAAHFIDREPLARAA